MRIESQGSKVLVIGPAWVGDMVMTQSLFKTLKLQNPQTEIDVVAPSWSEALLARMPEVRKAIPLVVAHGEIGLRKRWKLGQHLRQSGYARAIVLPRSAKAAISPWVANIPIRTGYLGEHRYGLLNDIRQLKNKGQYRTVDRFVALANEHPHQAKLHGPAIDPPQLDSTPHQQNAAMRSLHLTTDKPALALCPGAEYGPAKRWPPEHYATVARDHLADGWQIWLLGSGKDRAITQSIAEQAKGAIDLAGKTSLSQAIDLLGASEAVVSNDSGLMHVAAATGTPLVALYGSSDPEYTPPLSPNAEILYLGLECSPCFKRECPLTHLNCLQNLRPNAVQKALERATKLER